MLNIIFHYLIFLFIIFSNGFIFFKLFFFKNLELNLFESTVLGLVITGFVAQSINFFIPLSDSVVYFNLFISSIIIILYRERFVIQFNKKATLIVLAIIILSLFQIYGSGFSDDLAHYHGGQITNSDYSKYIIGVNFMHHHYGYGSIWLLLHSYLNFNSSFLQNIHIVNAITLLVVLSYFVTESLKITEKNKNFLFVVLGVFIFFFLLKYTRLKEFGLDRPGTLLFCFLIYLSLKYKVLSTFQQSNLIIIALLVSLFLTGIKLFFIFAFIIPLFLIIKFKNFKFFFTLEFIILSFFGIGYLGKNLLWSGCLIYPLYFTCFKQLSWNSKEIASKLFNWTEAHTKGFDSYKGILSRQEYLQDFNWVKTWFGIVSEELLNYAGLSIFIFIIIIALCVTVKNTSQFLWEKSILSILFFSNLALFLKTPVIRYHHTLFLLLTILLLVLLKKNFLKRKNIFYSILIVFFTFNLGKNFFRIHKNNYFNDPIQHLKKIEWYQDPKQKKLGSFIYYNGWIGASPIGDESLDKYRYKKIFFDIIYK